jgi:predicted RND superfamily exporter protein
MSSSPSPFPSFASRIPYRLDRYVHFLTAHPWRVLALWLLFVAAMSTGSGWLTFRSDERVFFAEENPLLVQLDAFQARYGKEDNAVILVHAREGDLIRGDRLAAIARITADAWKVPYARRVDSPTNFLIVSGNAEDMSVDHFWRTVDPVDPQALQKLREKANETPLLMGRILSRDFRTGIIVVSLRLPTTSPGDAETAPATDDQRPDGTPQNEDILSLLEGTAPQTGAAAPDDADPVGTIVADLRKRLVGYRAEYPELEFRLSGSVALDAAFTEASEMDAALLIPAMVTLTLLLLLAQIRSFSAVIATMLVIGASIGSALGLAGYCGVPLSSVSVASPFVIIIVALCGAVHFSFAVRRAEGAPAHSVADAMRDTAWPIFLMSATTATGFFSLGFSESPPFRHLGFICGSGTVFAWLYTMTMLPAFLSRFPPRKGRTGLIGLESSFRALGRWIARNPKTALSLALLPALFFSAFITRNQLDDRYIRYFDNRFEFRRDTDVLNQYLGGFYTLEFDLRGKGGRGISEPDYLHSVDRLEEWLRAQEGVTHVAGQADRIKMISRAVGSGGQEAYAIPDNGAVAEQLLALYELQLPYGFDLAEELVVDHSASRMTVALSDLSSAQTLELAEKTRDWIERNEPMLAGSAEATGTSNMFSHIGMRNIRNMITGTIVSFIVVAGFLLLAFRNFTLTAISMVANVLPGLAAIGGWGLIVGEVGMAVATIISMTLGIIVDDTIHIVTGIQHRLRLGLDVREAIEDTFGKVGPGVISTTVCLSSGFFVLALSGFQINAWIGLMTAIITLIAIIFDLFFVPAAFTLLYSRKETQQTCV